MECMSVLGIKKRLKRSPSIIVLNTVLPYHSRSFHWHNSHLHTPSQWRDLHSLSLYHSNYSLLHHYMSREWEHPLGWSWGLPRFTYDMCSATQGIKETRETEKIMESNPKSRGISHWEWVRSGELPKLPQNFPMYFNMEASNLNNSPTVNSMATHSMSFGSVCTVLSNMCMVLMRYSCLFGGYSVIKMSLTVEKRKMEDKEIDGTRCWSSPVSKHV